MEKPAILIFSLAYDPFIGGAEVAIKNIASRLSGQKFVMVTANIDGRQPTRERIGNIEVYRVGRGAWGKLIFPLAALGLAVKLRREYKFRVIWAMMANQAGVAALFYKWLFPKTAYLLSLQEGDSEEAIWRKTWFMRPLYKQIYRRADAIQAISTFLAKRAKALGAKQPIKVIPNGIDQQLIGRYVAGRKPALEQAEKIIITASRLVEKNGIADLIRAFALIEQSLRASAKLRILGDGQLRADLEALAKSLSVSEQVEFKGEISNEQVYNELSQADIFVRPSLSEGLGNSFLEAMAMGLPTIGTPVGGIVDFLRPGETGWLSPPHDPKALSKQIAYLLDASNSLEIKTVAAAGARLAINGYNWQGIAEQVASIFAELEDSKPHILIATGIYPPDIGGPATMVSHLAQALTSNGFRTTVLTYSQQPFFGHDQVIRIVKSGRLSQFKYLWKFFRLSRANDLSYVTDTYSVGYFAWLIKKMTGRKYIVRFAGDSAWETATANEWTTDYITDFEKNKYGASIERLKNRRRKIMRDADAVIAVSGFMAGLAETIGVKKDKIKMIYNSIDFVDGDAVGAPAGLPQDGQIIMTACRLTRWKGIDGLIKILPKINSQKTPVYLAILGDGPEMGNLKQLAEKLSISDKTLFLGRIEQSRVMGYIKAADVFCLNTNYEGLSHTLLEAMKAGTPIVATSVGGNPETIENGKSGLLVAYNDEAGLMTAILSVLNDSDLAARLSDAAAKRLEIFSWPENVRATISLIKQLL